VETMFVLVLCGLVIGSFYSYYARGARHRAQLAKLRQTIERLNSRERQHEVRYEELLRRFQSLELNVNKMHQRMEFTLPEEQIYSRHRRRESGTPLRPPSGPDEPLTP
jgi:predicted  nucleic acid-binding Zn-ribbon protein